MSPTLPPRPHRHAHRTRSHRARLVFEREGDRDAPPLILLHGITGSRHYWDRTAARLSRDYHVLRPDLLGFGESPKPTGRYDLPRHADTLRSWLEAEGLTDRPVRIVAHSLGGLITLEAALRWPGWIERAVLISLPCHRDRDDAHRSFVRGSPAYRRLVGAHSVRTTMSSWWAAGPGIASRYLFAFSGKIARDSQAWTLRSLTSTIEHCLLSHRVQERAGALQALDESVRPELLFLHGDGDQVVPPDPAMELAKELPSCRGEVVAGTGHHPMRTHLGELIGRVEGFLAQGHGPATER